MNSISIYNIKGGVGKTTIAVQLAKCLNFLYVSNDAKTGATDFVGDNGCDIPADSTSIPIEDDMIYDFAGEIDYRITEVLKETTVIVPTLISQQDVKATLTVLKDLSQIKDRVIVVVNKLKNEDDFIATKKRIEDENFDMYIDFLFIKDYNFLTKIEDLSIFETANKSSFYKQIYRNIVKEFEDLIATIGKVQEGVA